MLNTPTKRRRQKIVDLEVQGAMLRKIAVHWGLFFVCNTLALLIWIKMFEMPDQTWGTIANECLRRYFPFVLVTSVLFPAFLLDTLKFTSRFAGPIYRLREALRQAAAGEVVKPVSFRSQDYWSEIATNFNRVAGLVDHTKSDATTTQTLQK